MYTIPSHLVHASEDTRRRINSGAGDSFVVDTLSSGQQVVTVCHFESLTQDTSGDVIICCLPILGKAINPRVYGDWCKLTKAGFLEDGSFIFGPSPR